MIIRNEKNKNFSVVSNIGLNDERLSLKARGMYAYLLTKPEGWKITYRGLESQLVEGKDAILGVLKELEDAGYLERTKRNTASGAKWESILHEEPMRGLSVRGKPTRGKPEHIVNTDIVNTEKDISSETNEERTDSHLTTDEQKQVERLYEGYLIKFKINSDEWLYGDLEAKRALIAAAKKRYKLTPKRRDPIVRRLKDAGFEMCRKAIRGYGNDPFYRGEKPGHTWKAELDWIFKSYENVEKGANKFDEESEEQ